MMFLESAAVVFLGLIFGSFSTALIYRVPLKKNWLTNRSACPSCKHKLMPLDLIPLFSWLISGGQCRYCGKKISWIYPAIELVVLAACLGTYYMMGFSVESVFIMMLTPFLTALAVIDFRSMLLPNQLVFSVLVLGVARIFYFSLTGVFIHPSELLVPYALGALIYFFFALVLRYVLSALLKKDALGYGDVKFFLVSGLWLGISELPYFFIYAGTIGLCMSLIWRIFKKQKEFPFGPALIASLYILLLLQGSVLK